MDQAATTCRALSTRGPYAARMWASQEEASELKVFALWRETTLNNNRRYSWQLMYGLLFQRTNTRTDVLTDVLWRDQVTHNQEALFCSLFLSRNDAFSFSSFIRASYLFTSNWCLTARHEPLVEIILQSEKRRLHKFNLTFICYSSIYMDLKWKQRRLNKKNSSMKICFSINNPQNIPSN